MMIDVKEYALWRLPLQIRPIIKLVTENAAWLEEVKPGISEGYIDPQRAALRMARIARSEELSAFLIRKDKIAIGIGTIIANQTIQVKTNGTDVRLHGHDIDYWTDTQQAAELNAAGHADIYESLCEAAQLESTDLVFAALKPQEQARAYGLVRGMHAIGGLNPISTPNGDPYDIAKGGSPLQVFATQSLQQMQGQLFG